jgi:hypothetical protein
LGFSGANAQTLHPIPNLREKEIRHQGENDIRFHPMVVRAFGGEKGKAT